MLKIIADLHTHTRYSHGKGSVLNNVSVAMARGLQAVAITDHGPRSAPWVRASVQGLQAMRREVISIDQRTVGIRVLAGAECNIISLRGQLDVPAELRRELDIVLAGLHPGVLPASVGDWLWLRGLRGKARLLNTQAVVAAVCENEIDVITHPGHHLDIDTVELARACAQRGTAMEINASHETSVEYVRAAAGQGVRFVLSSDAHRPQDVGNLARAVAVARAAGLEPEQVINSDQGGLFEWLAERRGRRGRAQGWLDWADQLGLGGNEQQEERGARRSPSYWLDWSRQDRGVH